MITHSNLKKLLQFSFLFLYLFFYTCYSWHLFASTTAVTFKITPELRANPDDNDAQIPKLAYVITSGEQIPILTEKSSTTVMAYIPIKGSDSATSKDYSLLKGENIPTLSSTSKSLKFKFFFSIEKKSEQTLYLKFAVKSGAYFPVPLTSSVAITDSLTTVTGDIELEKICEAHSASCAFLFSSDSNFNSRNGNFTLYFYLETTEATAFGNIDASKIPQGGQEYIMAFSDKILAKNLSVSDIRRGDQRAIATVEDSNSLKSSLGTLGYKLGVFRKEVSGATCQEAGIDTTENNPWRTSGASFLQLKNWDIFPGKVTITKLQNGTPYVLSLGAVDKFGFVSPLSKSFCFIPMGLDTFLKKKSCFIVSAGFQEDHPALEFFRDLRDYWLLKFSLGKKFVSWYYQHTYPWALWIAKRPLFAKTVKALALSVFWICTYSFWIFLGSFFLLTQVLFFGFLKKKKQI